MGIKLNLGCGFQKLAGFVNVDCDAACEPDVLWNLEKTPWLWADNSVSEVRAEFVFEFLGETNEVWFAIVQELYRVCEHGAKITFTVTHPRHDEFLNHPCHVRALTLEYFESFNQALTPQYLAKKMHDRALGKALNVDFRMLESHYELEASVEEALERGLISSSELTQKIRRENNICTALTGVLRVVKDAPILQNLKPTWPSMPLVPMSWGDVFDRWTILSIKAERLSCPEQLKNVEREKHELTRIIGDLKRYPLALYECVDALRDMNLNIWEITEAIFLWEEVQQFDSKFIELVRSKYQENIRRAQMKQRISELLGSALFEEKTFFGRDDSFGE